VDESSTGPAVFCGPIRPPPAYSQEVHAAAVLAVAGLQLTLPAGWHGVTFDPRLSACDPNTLAVVGTAPPRVGSNGWARPGRGQVLVFVEEDHVNKPVGDLRRPARFQIPWTRFQRLEGCCGLPAERGATIWFRQRRRYLGFLVYAGPGVSTATRRATEQLLDSLVVR
jgi:hypothetical protein